MRRVAHALGPVLALLAWTLPFVRVTDCKGASPPVEYGGLEILAAESEAWVGVGFAVLLLGLAWVRDPAAADLRALKTALRVGVVTWGALLAWATALAPFLFQRVEALVGLWVETLGWAIAGCVAMVDAFAPVGAEGPDPDPGLRLRSAGFRWALLVYPVLFAALEAGLGRIGSAPVMKGSDVVGAGLGWYALGCLPGWLALRALEASLRRGRRFAAVGIRVTAGALLIVMVGGILAICVR